MLNQKVELLVQQFLHNHARSSSVKFDTELNHNSTIEESKPRPIKDLEFL